MKIIKLPKEKWGDPQSMPLGMSKNVYKEMVKEMKINASREDPFQQQCASEICHHRFILLCTSNLILA
jgi:hypothetical protein